MSNKDLKYSVSLMLMDSLKKTNLKELTDISKVLETDLREVLDRKCWRVISKLEEESLKILDAAFPNLLSGVPFDIALQEGNIRLLEKNREIYFQTGWEEIVAAALFSTKIKNDLTEFYSEQRLRKLKGTVGWLVSEMKFSTSRAFGRYISCLEILLLNRRHEIEAEYLEKLATIAVIRKQMEEHNLYLDVIEMDQIRNVLKTKKEYLQYKKFEKVYLGIFNEEIVEMAFDIFSDAELLMEEKELLEKENIEKILSVVQYNDVLQEKILSNYKTKGRLDVLYDYMDEMQPDSILKFHRIFELRYKQFEVDERLELYDI